MKTYIASPFFNSEQNVQVGNLENILDSLGDEYYSPRHHGNFSEMKLSKDLGLITRKLIFEDNIDRINWADRVIVNLNGHRDIGTLFEYGAALGLGKSVLVWIDKDTEVDGSFDNVQLMIDEVYFKILSSQSIRNTEDYLRSLNTIHLNKKYLVDTNEENSYPAGIMLLGYLYARRARVSYISNYVSKSNLMITESGIKQYKSLDDYSSGIFVNYDEIKVN